MSKSKKILVTGATGFIGQYIVKSLVELNKKNNLGFDIYAIGYSSSLNCPDVRFSQIDLSKPFELKGYDLIFHAAGYGQPAKFVNDPKSLVKINIDATISLLEGSPQATFIFFSSAEVYGDIPKELIPVKEDYNGNSPLHLPRSVYAESKRLGEALCAVYKKNKGMDVKIVRISHVYGPGLPTNDTRVMSEFIRKALMEKKIKLLDSGASVKTYGYVEDIVSMILFVAFEGKEMVYNIGGEDSVSILDLAKKIAKYLEVEYEVPKISSELAHVGKEPPIVKLDLSRIKKEMKELKFTAFEEGLAKTIEWNKNHI